MASLTAYASAFRSGSLHVLRHTAATIALTSDVPVHIVAARINFFQPAIKDKFGANACIVATRVAVDVVRHHRVRVEPVAVQVDIYNPALVAAIEAGKEPDAAAQDPDCWSAQLGFTGEPQEGDAIDLHVAFGRAHVSASIANRPQTALECGYP